MWTLFEDGYSSLYDVRATSTESVCEFWCNDQIFFELPHQRENLITVMEISGTRVSEELIAAPGKRVREMEVLVRGLIDELPDFGAIVVKISGGMGNAADEDKSDPEKK